MDLASPLAGTEPPRDCDRCPRLAACRAGVRAAHPEWWNAPIPAFGDPAARIVVIGLAPGRAGANRTGRAFTGDDAGDLFFATLAKFGLSEGTYDRRSDDGLRLRDVMVLNAVRCLPPENRPSPAEIRACRPFLEAAVAALPRARVIVALGRIAHEAAVRLAGGRLSAFPFRHGAVHHMPDGRLLLDSYHCSRYNQRTGRLTVARFEAVFAQAVRLREGE